MEVWLDVERDPIGDGFKPLGWYAEGTCVRIRVTSHERVRAV